MPLVKPTCRTICIVMFWNLIITEIVPPIYDWSLNPSSLLQTHEFRQQNKLENSSLFYRRIKNTPSKRHTDYPWGGKYFCLPRHLLVIV